MASFTLEKPFFRAISDGKIFGVVMEARSVSGPSYSRYIGTQTSPSGTSKPLDPSSLPYVASATKLWASLAALQLVEQGKLSLDGDLSPVLSKLTDLGVLVGLDTDSEGNVVPKTEPLNKPLTLRHLLTHSCGHDYMFFNPLRAKYRAAFPPPKPSPDQVSRFLMPATYHPGESWMYSHGNDLAVHLVERATGQKFDAYIREHIFGPVGVAADDVSYFPVREGLGDRMPDLSPQDPKGYGLATTAGFNPHDDGDVCFGGHGGYATARAYVAVLESILKNDGRILSPEMREEMFKPQLEPKAKEGLEKALSTPAGPAFGCGTSGKDRDMGLCGLLVGEDGDGGLGKGSTIWGGGHNTTWFVDPKNGCCGFASPQMKMPTDVAVATELKRVFREGVGSVLREAA